MPVGKQNLIWLDGEALCVTREFWSALGERVPDWLAPPPECAGVASRSVSTPARGNAVLTQRVESRPLAWLWSVLRRRPFTSPELRQAATLFRLQRQGLPTPTLLAVGQRHRLWRTESFLLTETPSEPAEERAS